MSDEGEFTPRAEDESSTARPRRTRKPKQTDASADPVLPEKKRARRRLVGAIALVLAAVIGLPMILDSEPKPLANDIEIDIPSREQINTPRKARPASEPADTALDHDEQIIEPVEPTTSGAGNKEVAKPVIDSKATEPKPSSVTANPTPKTNPAPVAKPAGGEAKLVEKAEPKAKSDDDREAARAKAILEGRGQAGIDSVKTSADKTVNKYMIQVAALSSEEKITELRNKMKAAGISSHTQKVATASGDRTRVRVGPFATKEEAEKTRAKLVKLGLNGTLVPVSN